MDRIRALLRTEINKESHRAVPLELFFDLVYVFAFTRVTVWIAREPSILGTAQGLLILGIMWWTWVAWAWTGNVLRADRGLPMVGFLVAMPAVLTVALTVDYVWDVSAGAPAVWLFAGGYLAIRLIHLGVYAASARTDQVLLRRVLWTGAAWVPAGALLVVGAMLPPDERFWWWLGTFVLDLGATWILAVTVGGWEVRSSQHLAERYGQVVTIAIGLSVVAPAAVLRDVDLRPDLVATAVLGVVLAIALWWPYFKGVLPGLQKAMKKVPRGRQSDVARDAYTYMHFPLVAGIVMVAVSLEHAFFTLTSDERSGFAAIALSSGAALYCLCAGVINRIGGGKGYWLLGSAAFFATATVWMPEMTIVAALAISTVALFVAGIFTPRTSTRTTKAVEGK